MKNSRLIAFETLYKIFYDSAYSNIALDKVLKEIDEDKAFISALVYGVVERKLTLDYFINKYLDTKPKPKILIILRLGAYQLLFMDKVPASAAINESVKLTKIIKQNFYSKLVNAVLHKIDNDREIPQDKLSVKYSVPQNLINMWTKQYGRETCEKFISSINEKPPVFAAPNTAYVDCEELLYELKSEGVDGEITGDAVKITSSFDLSKLNSFANGLFYIQDLSSFLCAKSLDAQPDETVLDICSAPGGKAFTIALSMKNRGKIYCYDLYEHRLKLIDNGAKKLGINIIETEINDGSVYNASIPQADRIICDVPCSGFGIIRRKPEIRYKELDSVKELPEIQLNILNVSSKYLKSGGRMIYSTCTLNKKENENVVSKFLENDKEFTLIEEKTFFPASDSGDGFFFALIEKKNEN